MARFSKPSVGWHRSVNDLLGVLRGISDPKTQARILGRGVRAAVAPIEIAAKRFARRSEDTGALRDSITTKVVEYANRASAPAAVGLVGPDRAYRSKGRKVGALGRLLLRHDLRRPANYAHLIEYGHRIAKGGSLRDKHKLELVGTGRYSTKGKELKRWKRGAILEQAKGTAGGFVPPKPFLRPAVITTRAQQAAAFEKAVAAGLAAELKRLNRAGGRSVTYRRAA